MDAIALVFQDKEIVPEGSRLRFGVVANDNHTVFIEQALALQGNLDLIEFVLDLGLHTIDVKARGISMALNAGGDIGRKGVAGIWTGTTQVAGDAGVFHSRVVGRRLACNSTRAAHTEDQRGFRTVMTTPVGAGNADLAIRRCRGRPCVAGGSWHTDCPYHHRT